MKTILTLIAVLFVGCGKSELEAENKRLEAELEEAKRKVAARQNWLHAAEENNKKLKDDLRRIEVVGTYKLEGESSKLIFKNSGMVEVTQNENDADAAEYQWAISGNTVVIKGEIDKGKSRLVLRIESNGDLTENSHGKSTFKKSNNPK